MWYRRVTIPIAKEGFSIAGLDLLYSMLKEAKRKSEEQGIQIQWIEEDMSDFALNKKCNLILMPGCAFNWLLELKQVEKCLTCVKKHLNPKSVFIFDAFNPNLEFLLRDPSKTYPNAKYQDPDGKGLVEVTENNTYDKATQINEIQLIYSIEDKIINSTLKLRIFFPQELDALLKYNGVKINIKYGDFDLSPFSSDSRRQIFICRI